MSALSTYFLRGPVAFTAQTQQPNHQSTAPKGSKSHDLDLDALRSRFDYAVDCGDLDLVEQDACWHHINLSQRFQRSGETGSSRYELRQLSAILDRALAS